MGLSVASRSDATENFPSGVPIRSGPKTSIWQPLRLKSEVELILAVDTVRTSFWDNQLVDIEPLIFDDCRGDTHQIPIPVSTSSDEPQPPQPLAW